MFKSYLLIAFLALLVICEAEDDAKKVVTVPAKKPSLFKRIKDGYRKRMDKIKASSFWDERPPVATVVDDYNSVPAV